MNREFIEECIYSTPLALDKLRNKFGPVISEMLPSDTGIEIESPRRDSEGTLKDIPNLKEFRIGYSETSFRIPSGIDGMICLYEVLLRFKTHWDLNPNSGIHYHIDLGEYKVNSLNLTQDTKETVLKELDKWDYKGSYNRRGVEVGSKSVWLNLREHFNTAEIRIGEMSFEYEVLIKRILHGHYIAKLLTNSYEHENSPEYWINKLKDLNKIEESTNEKEIEGLIKNRVIKL